MKTTWVIPIKTHTHDPKNDELERFLEIGLRSYKKFLDPAAVHSFMMICPDDELVQIKDRTDRFCKQNNVPFEFKFSKDSWLIPATHDPNVREMMKQGGTWVYQQLLKLEVARIIYTPVYMVVDSDVYLTKKFTEDSIYVDTYKDLFLAPDHPGSALKHPLITTTDPFYYHPEWYEASCSQLRTPVNQLFPTALSSGTNRVLQVTPQLLVKQEVIQMLQHLKDIKDPLNYQIELLQKGFTEYSLYWSWLTKQNHTELYDMTCGGNKGGKEPINNYDIEIESVRLLGRPIWFKPKSRDDLVARIRTQFEENACFYFGLLQSNIQGITTQDAIQIIRPYLVDN